MKDEIFAITDNLSSLLVEAGWMVEGIGKIWHCRPSQPIRDGEDLGKWLEQLGGTDVEWLAMTIHTFPGRVDELQAKYQLHSQAFLAATPSPTCGHDEAIDWLASLADHLRVYTRSGDQTFDKMALVASVAYEWTRGSGPLRVITEMSNPLGTSWRSRLRTECAKAETRKSRPRKRAVRRPPKESGQLTTRQVEAMQLWGECEGNVSEVGRRMGINRVTAQQHIDAARAKLGESAVTKNPKTTRLPVDRRGQIRVANGGE